MTVELWLYLDNAKGEEEKFVWSFSPVSNPDFAWDILRNDKARATGSESTRAFAIKEIRTLEIGAGTLRNPDHHDNFIRFLLAKKILWNRRILNKDVQIEFSPKIDAQMKYEFLSEVKSLRRKTIELWEKDFTWYPDFFKFIKERKELWNA